MGLTIEAALFGGILFALVVCLRRDIRISLGIVVGLAVLIRVAALLFTTILLDNPTDSGFAYTDDRNYHLVSEQVVDLWGAGETADPADIRHQAEKNKGYYYLTSILYWCFGKSQYVSSVFNIFAGSLTVLLVFLVGEFIWNRNVGLRAALIIAVLPDVAIWSSLQFKDTVVGLLVLWCVFNLQRIALNELRLSVAANALIGLVVLYAFRAETSFFMTISFAAAYIATRESLPGTRVLGFFAGAGLFAVIGLLVFGSLEQGLFAGSALVEQIRVGASIPISTVFAAMLNYFSQAAVDSAGMISLGYMFGPQDLWRLPISLAFVLLMPFPPWPRGISTGSDLISIASVPWLVLVPLVVISVGKSWRAIYDRSKVLLVYLTLDWLSLAVFLFVFSPTRHRVASIPLFILIASAHWPKQQSVAWWIWMSAVAAMVLAMPIYFFVL